MTARGRTTAGLCLAALLCAAAAAQAREYFTQPRARAGDRELHYRVERAVTTSVVRYERRCEGSDAVCVQVRTTYRDRVLEAPGPQIRAFSVIRRRPSFKTGRGYLIYDRDATAKIVSNDVLGNRQCTETTKLRYSSQRGVTMTYSMVLAKGRVSMALESRFEMPWYCFPGGLAGGLDDRAMRLQGVVPTFSFPLSALKGRRVTLDLRDPGRQITFETPTTGTMSSRLQLTLVRDR